MKIPFVLLSFVMILMAIFSFVGDELIKTVLFSTEAIWILLVGILMKEG